MKDKIFVDSNIWLYLLGDDERKEKDRKTILNSYPIISTQVVSENINVLFKKFPELTLPQISGHANMLATYCTVSTLTFATIEKALVLKANYGFQWYDNTILSAAILAECSIIYSEDMQHNQLIEGRLRIINPFL